MRRFQRPGLLRSGRFGRPIYGAASRLRQGRPVVSESMRVRHSSAQWRKEFVLLPYLPKAGEGLRSTNDERIDGRRKYFCRNAGIAISGLSI